MQEEEEDNSSLSKSKKKRELNDNTDVLYDLICSKMSALETASPEDKKDGLVESFISVLECSKDEAIFFLESANWAIDTAISLCIEGGDRNFTSKRLHNINYDGSAFRESLRPPLFYKKNVQIIGLSTDWTAQVSSTTGCIYFIHNESGHTQHSVPPGFADANDAPKNDIEIDNDDMNDYDNLLLNANNNNNNNNNNISPILSINTFRNLDNPFNGRISGLNPFSSSFESNNKQQIKELGNGYELGDDGEDFTADDDINTSNSNCHVNNDFDINEDDII